MDIKIGASLHNAECRLGERRPFGADWEMMVGNRLRLRDNGSRQVGVGI